MDKNDTDIMSPGADEQAATGAIPAQGGKVRDIMTPAPVGVYYSQTIGETARIMRDTQVGAVLVVNDGALSGVVTDRDLVLRGLAEGEGPDSPVGPLCSGDLIGVAADAGRLPGRAAHAGARRPPAAGHQRGAGRRHRVNGRPRCLRRRGLPASRGQPRPAEYLVCGGWLARRASKTWTPSVLWLGLGPCGWRGPA